MAKSTFHRKADQEPLKGSGQDTVRKAKSSSTKRASQSQVPNKHEIRTTQTRQLLLRAAEKVFVRDGYEGSELGEIATLAGRTKGAIYAHFKNKEDLFLALFRHRAEKWSQRFVEMIGDSSDPHYNLQALQEFTITLSEDRAWLLLVLEFKLYAARTSKSRERLRSVYQSTYPSSEIDYEVVFGQPEGGSKSISRSSAVLTILPILSALAVEEQFAPSLIKTSVHQKIIARLFEALMH